MGNISTTLYSLIYGAPEKKDSKPLFDTEGYWRYLRLGRSLLYMKEALHGPLQSEIEKLHQELLKNTNNKSWFKNEDEEIKKKALCDYLQNKYGNVQTEGTCKGNVNIQNWESMPWETAKLFMQPRQTERNKGPEFTDVMGILKLIMGCKQFNDWLEGEIDGTTGHSRIRAVLDLRNVLAHSHSLCCSEEEFETGISQITKLLNHIQQNFKSSVAERRTSDEKTVYKNAETKIQAALIMIDKVRTDTDFGKMRELVVKDIYSSRVYESSQEASVEVYDVLIFHCEDDIRNASDFQKHLDALSNLQPPAKTIIYDEYLAGGAGYLEAQENILEECRLVFILYTEAFKQDNLAQFQAEVIKCTCLEKNEGKRVVPVYLTEKDFKSSPKWMKAVSYIAVWNHNLPKKLLKTIKQGRRNYLI